MRILLYISILLISLSTNTSFGQEEASKYAKVHPDVVSKNYSKAEQSKLMSFHTTKLLGFAKTIKENSGKNLSEKRQKILTHKIKSIMSEGPQLVRTFSLDPKPESMRMLISIQELSGIKIYKSADLSTLKFSEYTQSHLRDMHAERIEGKPLLLGQSNTAKIKTYFKRFVTEFKTAFPAFTAAQFAVGAMHTGSNPVGIEQVAQQLEDPFLMTSSFAVFIGGSHLAQAAMPRSMKPKFGQAPGFGFSSVGLGVGMFLSAVYAEVYNDIKFGLIHECIKDFEIPKGMTDKNKINGAENKFNTAQAKSCKMAEQKWKTHDKYVNYVPDVTSLITAFGMTHQTFAGTAHIISKTKFLKDVAPALRAIGLNNPVAAGAFAFGAAFGNFVVFMNYHHPIMPYFTRPWNHMNFTGLGWSLSQELKGDKPADNTDFLRTYRSVQRKVKWLDTNLPNIKNAMTYEYFSQCVDSTANNFKSKEFWARMTFKQIDKLNFAYSTGKSFVKQEWDFPQKSYEQAYIMEACNQYSNPSIIVASDYAFTKERQRLRLQTFSQKQANWMQFLGNYTQRINDTKAIYSKMLQLKKEFTPTDSQPYPAELSFESFKESFNDSKGSYPEEYEIANVKFNHMSEFYIFQMLCGPELGDNPGKGAAANHLEDNQNDIPFIKTPFGSSLKFIPPKVTATKSDICKSKDFNTLGQVSNYEKQVAQQPGDRSDIFNGVWKDKKIARLVKRGKSNARSQYSNLAEYVFDNLDVKALETIIAYDEELEGYAWTNYTLDILNDVWAAYEESYKKLIKKSLIPLIIKTTPSGDINSLGYKWGNMKKGFMNALNLKPFVPEAKARFAHKLNRLEATAKALDRITPEFTNTINELKQLISKELDAQSQYVKNWNNRENYSGQEQYFPGQHISQDLFLKLIGLRNSLSELDFEALDYHPAAIAKALSPNCDPDELAQLQEENSEEYSGVITCKQLDLALDLHTNMDEAIKAEDLIVSQLGTLTQEIADYNQTMIQLFNVIGNFKK